MGCHFFLQGIFSTQGSNLILLHLLHCTRILYWGYYTAFILGTVVGIQETECTRHYIYIYMYNALWKHRGKWVFETSNLSWAGLVIPHNELTIATELKRFFSSKENLDLRNFLKITATKMEYKICLFLFTVYFSDKQHKCCFSVLHWGSTQLEKWDWVPEIGRSERITPQNNVLPLFFKRSFHLT